MTSDQLSRQRRELAPEIQLLTKTAAMSSGCGLCLSLIYKTSAYDSLESGFQSSGGELMGQNSGEGRVNSIPT